MDIDSRAARTASLVRPLNGCADLYFLTIPRRQGLPTLAQNLPDPAGAGEYLQHLANVELKGGRKSDEYTQIGHPDVCQAQLNRLRCQKTIEAASNHAAMSLRIGACATWHLITRVVWQ